MKVKHSVVNNNKLNTVPVVNGQIVYVKDTHDLYFDVDNVRAKATDIIFVDTLQERDEIQNPISNKIYCVLEDNCFYTYKNNSWTLLGGNITKSYVDTQDGVTLTNAQTYADTNFLKKNNTIEFTPTANYHPATKKYVDDNCIPYQPFPAGLDTSHTTQEFITSIRALNLPAGSTYLGGVILTDMPFTGNAEVEIYVYPANVIYLTLRSTNISPYMWECNSHTYRGWEAVGKAYTDNKLSTYVQNTDYATNNVGGVIKTGNGFNVLSGVPNVSGYATFDDYKIKGNGTFIGKGTLETVLNNSIIKTGSTTPTTSTVGYRIGQFYLNITDNKVYQLTAIDDTDPNAIVYTWQQLIRSTDLANYTPSSASTTFDNTGTTLVSTNVEDAIKELLGKINTLDAKIGEIDTLVDEINGE